MLCLHDTASGEVRALDMRTEGEVSMYVCGPTVYDFPHLGHGRATLTFDVIRRYLEFRGLRVHHVANVTDIDDNIIRRAEREARTEQEVAAEFEGEWWAAMDRLGVKRPHDTPHATEWVDQMVELVSSLLDSGKAYRTDDGVYLSVDKVEGYGLLKHQDLETLRSGARVEVDDQKRSPLDFALWKAAKPGEPTWPAPFGAGRPGWHTECVVMSLGLLGDGFDLHGGGVDLIFPHHENERAQAVALGRQFARHWVHHAFVMVDDEKMSKSLGNFRTLTDLLSRADGRAYRLLVLRSRYTSPMEVTEATIDDATKGLERLDAMARRFGVDPAIGHTTYEAATAAGADMAAADCFCELMDDNLDTPGALALVFDLAAKAHSAADGGDLASGRQAALTATVLAGALGLLLRPGSSTLDDATAALKAERDRRRAAGDYAGADAIRQQLIAEGWTVEDGPEGTRLHR